MDDTSRQIGELREEMRAGFKDLRAEIKDLGTEVKDVRSEVKDVRVEVKDVRAEIASQISGLRSEVASQFNGLRSEMAVERGEPISASSGRRWNSASRPCTGGCSAPWGRCSSSWPA
ncbi:MAG TPA: hypothetical protein VLK56_02085, partial [Solirubrobacterales bacterium]|nr:hypothetical protein [Solirubrobacterales bacterium]